MLTWLVDHISILYWPLLFAALAAAAFWWSTRKRGALLTLAGIAAVAALVFLISLVVDTDRKRLTRALEAIAQGMTEKPPVSLFQHISDRFNAPFLVSHTTRQWTKADLRRVLKPVSKSWNIDRVVIKDLEFQTLTDKEAKITFAALPVGDFTALACPCEALFVREDDGQWRMTSLRIFNPFVNTTDLVDIPIGD
jgi:hypothetical protein